jgi:TPR repeat protein
MATEMTASEGPIAPQAPIVEAQQVDAAFASLETSPSVEVRQAVSPPAEMPVSAEPPVGQSNSPERDAAESLRPATIVSALSAEQLSALVARGDALVQMRDLTSARLYFQRAAEAGDGRAALRMGQTFDPALLGRVGIFGVPGDAQQAVYWYRHARDLGDADAARLLEKLKP